MRRIWLMTLSLFLVAFAIPGCSPKSASIFSSDAAAVDETPVTKEMVVDEFLHAWRGYKRHAWGDDALKPLSKSGRDWYEQSLLMTPLDAFDTMLIMGLEAEAAEAKELILCRLSFDHDLEVQHFEVSIRILGGLLSAYQMDGDPRFLELAIDLADRMLPAFDSPTGMPYRLVNLSTGKTRGRLSNPAEIGTYLLEYGTLSKLTGDEVYYEKAKAAAVALYDRRSRIGLVGTLIDVETGVWLVRSSHVGGGIDSYYEYLLKSWLLFGDQDCKRMWDTHLAAVNRYLADEVDGGLWYGHANMNSGRLEATYFGALYAFWPGALALGGDLERAARLEDSCYRMWTRHGIEPEFMDYKRMRVIHGTYILRPEIIESAYYLYHYTGDPKYQRMGYVYFNSLVKHCKTDVGFAAIADVRTMKQSDAMESFFLAETLKYFYLLFAEPEALDLESVILNTEAHPIRKTW